MIKVLPSLLAADLMHLGDEIERMLKNGPDTLHFDVMDAHFVPNLSFGPALCKVIGDHYPACKMDVHLMMEAPGRYVDVFSKAGADTLTVHKEAVDDAKEILNQIQAAGMRRGLSIKPQTAVEELLPYLSMLDQVLIMTVEPGFGGQAFMPKQLDKVRALRTYGFAGDIAVDGGIKPENAALAIDAGANLLIMGTAYFCAEDPARVIREIEGKE